MHQPRTNHSLPSTFKTWFALSLAVILPAMIPACDSVEIVVNTGDLPGEGEPQPQPGPVVTLRLANLTEAAVEAEIYVSTNALDNTPDTLFVEENLFTEGIGLAATGLLAPLSTDVAEMACTNGMVLGTAGGSFCNPQTGAELGTGSPRILQQGLVFDCNAEITLVYRVEGGSYSVDLTLE